MVVFIMITFCIKCMPSTPTGSWLKNMTLGVLVPECNFLLKTTTLYSSNLKYFFNILQNLPYEKIIFSTLFYPQS